MKPIKLLLRRPLTRGIRTLPKTVSRIAAEVRNQFTSVRKLVMENAGRKKGVVVSPRRRLTLLDTSDAQLHGGSVRSREIQTRRYIDIERSASRRGVTKPIFRSKCRDASVVADHSSYT